MAQIKLLACWVIFGPIIGYRLFLDETLIVGLHLIVGADCFVDCLCRFSWYVKLDQGATPITEEACGFVLIGGQTWKCLLLRD